MARVLQILLAWRLMASGIYLGGRRSEIDLYNAPGYRRGMESEYMDGLHVAVLHSDLRERWVAFHHSIVATDVWFAAPAYCTEYAAAIPEWSK